MQFPRRNYGVHHCYRAVMHTHSSLTTSNRERGVTQKRLRYSAVLMIDQKAGRNASSETHTLPLRARKFAPKCKFQTSHRSTCSCPQSPSSSSYGCSPKSGHTSLTNSSGGQHPPAGKSSSRRFSGRSLHSSSKSKSGITTPLIGLAAAGRIQPRSDFAQPLSATCAKQLTSPKLTWKS